MTSLSNFFILHPSNSLLLPPFTPTDSPPACSFFQSNTTKKNKKKEQANFFLFPISFLSPLLLSLLTHTQLAPFLPIFIFSLLLFLPDLYTSLLLFSIKTPNHAQKKRSKLKPTPFISHQTISQQSLQSYHCLVIYLLIS